MMQPSAACAPRINGRPTPLAVTAEPGERLAAVSSPPASYAATAGNAQPISTISDRSETAESPLHAILLRSVTHATPSEPLEESKPLIVPAEQRSQLSEYLSVAMGLSFFAGFVCGAGATAIILLLAYFVLG